MRYVMVNCLTNSFCVFKNVDELVYYFSKKLSECEDGYFRETFFKQFNYSGTDCDIVDTSLNNTKKDVLKEQKYQNLKPYIIYDENFKLVDIRLFKKEILEKNFNKQNITQNSPKTNNSNYIFRYDPVPGIHKPTKKPFRKVHYHKEFEDIYGKDISFFRPKRKNKLICFKHWNFPTRCLEKSWKSQTKNPKQWMKKL